MVESVRKQEGSEYKYTESKLEAGNCGFQIKVKSAMTVTRQSRGNFGADLQGQRVALLPRYAVIRLEYQFEVSLGDYIHEEERIKLLHSEVICLLSMAWH